MFGMTAAAVAGEIIKVLAEQEYIDSLPPDERELAIAKRAERYAESKRERERKEALDAIRPKTLWFYLGLSRH